ncbi:hypothetical protein J3Q64DRAFT_1752518 [Phycomyces blakesleeanus]
MDPNSDHGQTLPAGCLLADRGTQQHQPQAEDILIDEDLLDLFRIIKLFLRKRPNAERIAKLLFCISYALSDNVKFYRPLHDNHMYFRDETVYGSAVHSVQLLSNTVCCNNPSNSTSYRVEQEFPASSCQDTASASSISSSSLPRLLSVSYLTHPTPDDTSTDAHSVRPYTHFRPLYPYQSNVRREEPPTEVLMEPRQRGFYYQDGRISREPALLQRYAEQGVLTQASLMRKRKRQTSDTEFPYELTSLPSFTKKSKIPHRHGEFEQRREDILTRMRLISMADLEQKASRLPDNFTLAIKQASIGTGDPSSQLEPALRILTEHSNMKPHLDNGMNQNGIYYNTDYYRLYLAFDQFQKIFAQLFPQEIGTDLEADREGEGERDRDKERNANMKAYRVWIEPLLTETNWAAFRRNIVVGERMVQLTNVVGQGLVLMTKELSGSKLHLTFTNNEWDDFINGLIDPNDIQDLKELQSKFSTCYWFRSDGNIVTVEERARLLSGQSNIPHSPNSE